MSLCSFLRRLFAEGVLLRGTPSARYVAQGWGWWDSGAEGVGHKRRPSAKMTGTFRKTGFVFRRIMLFLWKVF